MNLEQIEKSLNAINGEASFIFSIQNKAEHRKALELIELLLGNNETHEILIDLLCHSVEKYENYAPEFSEFNKKLLEVEAGNSALAVLMDQHNVKAHELSHEIGGEGLVSMVLNGKRELTTCNVKKLSARFNVQPTFFM